MTDLIKRAQNGDMAAFEELIVQYEKDVYNVAYRMFNNAEDAKDIAQDVFIKVFKNIKKYEEKSSFRTWIYTIANNACIDEIRKRKRRETESMDKLLEGEDSSYERQFSDGAPTPEDLVVIKEDLQMVQRAMTMLSAEHKLVIILKDIKELSYEEIVTITGLSLGTVKSRISRARQNLRKLIAEQRME